MAALIIPGNHPQLSSTNIHKQSSDFIRAPTCRMLRSCASRCATVCSVGRLPPNPSTAIVQPGTWRWAVEVQGSRAHQAMKHHGLHGHASAACPRM